MKRTRWKSFRRTVSYKTHLIVKILQTYLKFAGISQDTIPESNGCSSIKEHSRQIAGIAAKE